MNATPIQEIQNRVAAQKRYRKQHDLSDIKQRIKLLKQLKSSIFNHENELKEALYKDLHKSGQEAFITEIGLVIKEIDKHIKWTKEWARTKRVKTPLYLLPSSSQIIYEPKGVVLIVAPWNYPFQLLMTPLVGAVSAGNSVVLKPSEFCIHTNAVMDQIVQDVFTPEQVTMVHGGKEENQTLFAEKFDMIFFTGSPRLGKIVMKAAAEHLTPVVLELGGKSPCIVDQGANISMAAKRIAWGKTVNLGQTCIAPDYLLVHESVKKELEQKIIQNWENLYGKNPQESEFLARMITPEAFNRVTAYLENGKVIHGGQTDRKNKFIGPTLMDEIDLESDLMRDEIFGPILPIISYSDIQEAIDLINSKERPLAYYYFGKSRRAKSLLEKNTSGGGCINDTLIHISNHGLPFGGTGNSGFGRYHGKDSFEAFSNIRSIMKSPTWIDLPFRYPPFKFFGFVKRLLS